MLTVGMMALLRTVVQRAQCSWLADPCGRVSSLP